MTMQMTKEKQTHTPGPKMYGRTILFDHGKRAEITSEHQEWTDALARLIAAAPEMLETLKELTRILSHIKDRGQADPLRYVPVSAYQQGYEKARALLAKVEGEDK